MHKDIRLHGQTGDQIEYFAMVAGNRGLPALLLQYRPGRGSAADFLARQRAVIIGPEGISYQGNGGYFCEYMFGVDQPSSDLVKPEIINRLVMYGARADETSGTVRFSDRTAGSETYDNIFFEGNAVCNYFFFVHSNLLSRKLKNQQEELVKRHRQGHQTFRSRRRRAR